MSKVSIPSENGELELVEDFDQDAYATVASNARLLQIYLVTSNYEAKIPELLVGLNDDSDLKFGFTGGVRSCELDHKNGVLVGGYEWEADVKLGRKKLLKLKCSYVAVYENLFDCQDEYQRYYFRKIGRFTTYPYFRAQFATHVADSGLSLPPLPSLTERVD